MILSGGLGKRARIYTASFAALAILVGGGVFAVTYYRHHADTSGSAGGARLPDSIVLANDGKTQLAVLGGDGRAKEGDAQRAIGPIVDRVYEELRASGVAPDDLRTGGYRIVTTIDAQAQRLLERSARPDLPGSQLYGRTVLTGAGGRDLESAGVVIDHTNGRVLAYYGGINGATDLAGTNDGSTGLYGGHPPGPSMAIYTLAAALDAGASLGSHWRALPFTTDDGMKIGNGGAANTGCKDYCTLDYSLMKAYRVPFYWVARQVGPGSVVGVANRAGVQHMWDAGGREALSSHVQDPKERAPFDRQVGFGQYAVTVLDHAAGVATFANGGTANTPHFVLRVEKMDSASGSYRLVERMGERLAPRQAIRRAVADDVAYAMQKVLADHAGWPSAVDGRAAAVMTGAWGGATVDAAGKSTPSSDNSDAWTVGFTKQLSVAVWTGNAAGTAPVLDPMTKRTITGGTAFRIWSGFVASYSAAANLPKEKLAAPSHTGRDDFPGATGVR